MNEKKEMIYIVATMIGGVMEMPDITYSDFRKVKAKDEKDAVAIYNKKMKCSYFYGEVVGYMKGDELEITKNNIIFIDKNSLEELK